MARFELKIDYSLEKMARSWHRLEARADFRNVNRVLVMYGLFARYSAPLFNLRNIDCFWDAERHYYWQLQFAKYRLENIPEDYCTGVTIFIHPFFGNVIPPSGHGNEVGWVEDDPPRAIPVIETVEQMERFEVAKPDTGLRGKSIEWWLKMKEFAAETEVTFNGHDGHVDVEPLDARLLEPAYNRHRLGRRHVLLVDSGISWAMPPVPRQDYSGRDHFKGTHAEK